MEENKVFEFDGGVGDVLAVYEDRVAISHKGMFNLLTMGSKGEKTIYFNNITSVQIKLAGFASGYIQFSINGGRENVGGIFGAMCDENSITIGDERKNKEAEEVVVYINKKLAEVKKGVVRNEISCADELKKFKELFDMGVITQEEFDEKKKQLLGL